MALFAASSIVPSAYRLTPPAECDLVRDVFSIVHTERRPCLRLGLQADKFPLPAARTINDDLRSASYKRLLARFPANARTPRDRTSSHEPRSRKNTIATWPSPALPNI